MLTGLHQGFGMLLQRSGAISAQVSRMVGVLRAGRASPGVGHAYKLKCYT